MFQTIQGLYLLGFLLPLLLLYLIKAKPKELTIPSLMFFSNLNRAKKFNALFQKLLVRTLFFLQLLFIVLLALSAANLTVSIPVDSHAFHTAVVVDMSASMQTREGGITRMDLNRDALLDSAKGRVSIILARDTPAVLASNITSSRARALLSQLAPADTKTRLDAAVLLANDLLGQERANIVVYSDFAVSRQDDLLAVKKLVEANDKRLTLLPTGSPRPNLGFVDLNFRRGSGEAFIRNFGERNEVIDVRLSSSQSKATTRLEIPKGGTERIVFEIPQGETTLAFSGDALETDNTLFILNPHGGKVNLLFITNQPDSTLLDALQANTQFDIEVAQPPVLPEFRHDLIVLGPVSKDLLLPNTFRDIKRYLDAGGAVVITAQDRMNEMDFQGLLPFSVRPSIVVNKEVCTEVVTGITTRLSTPRCFTSTFKHFPFETVSDSAIVLAAHEDGNPVLVQDGRLFVYGIQDKLSPFQDQIVYPLFWDDVITTLLGRESISNFNFRTGDVLIQDNQDNRSQSAYFDTIGFQTAGGREVAVNLLSAEESNIYQDSLLTDSSEFQSELENVPLDVNFAPFLLWLATALFFYEIWYVKRRGDL